MYINILHAKLEKYTCFIWNVNQIRATRGTDH